MGRGDLSDEEWDLIGRLLTSERGRWARPAGDIRRVLNGMLHVLRVGCPWRDMHERYGKWNSVYVRFSNRPFGSSTFRLSTMTVSTSLTGSRFSSESAPRPFQHGVRERSGTIFWAALPAD